MSWIAEGTLDEPGAAIPGVPSAFAAHGATVAAAAGAGRGAVAQGALVPASGACLVGGVASFGRDWGPEAMCAEVGGGTVLGSRSQLKRDPKGKCCTTGNLESTSALYILIIPWEALSLVPDVHGVNRPCLSWPSQP